jgi:hypothetical protein
MNNEEQSELTRKLLLRYLNDDLDGGSAQQLNEQLRGNEDLRREAALLLLQEAQLFEIGEARRELGPEYVEEIRATLGSRMMGLLLGVVRRPAWAIGLAGLAAGIVLCAIALAGLTFLAHPKIGQVEGNVTIERNQERLIAHKGARLRPGDRVTVGQQGLASIRFARAGLTVWLSESTRLSLGDHRTGVWLFLESGSLGAALENRRRGMRVRLRTTQAEVEVVGTTFNLKADQNSTRVEVWKGEVHVTSASDGSAVLINAGHYAVAASGTGVISAQLEQGVLLELWRPIPGSEVQNLTSSARFTGRADQELRLPQLELRSRLGDNYGLRLRGFLHPPASGEYRFWIAADDSAEFWVSPSERPELKEVLCYTPEHTNPREWEKRPEQASRGVKLEAGRKYYLEVLMKQSGGAECLGVAWRGPQIERQIIGSQFLSPARQQTR